MFSISWLLLKNVEFRFHSSIINPFGVLFLLLFLLFLSSGVSFVSVSTFRPNSRLSSSSSSSSFPTQHPTQKRVVPIYLRRLLELRFHARCGFFVFLDLRLLTQRSSLKISFLIKRGSKIAVAEEEEQRYREKERDLTILVFLETRSRPTRERERERERGFAMRL